MRSIRIIAAEIYQNWEAAQKNPYHPALPYIRAMMSLDKISDNYGFDRGRDIVNYFLANAATWRGEKARAIKAELKEMLK